MKKLIFLILACLLFSTLFVACNNTENNADETTDAKESTMNETTEVTETTTSSHTTVADETTVIEETTAIETTTDETTLPETDATTEEITTTIADKLEISEDSLSDVMKNMFSDNTLMKNETLFFIDKGDTKRLIYPATKILSVTSYDGKVTYTEGVDYVLTEDGKLQVTENSAIPCITSEVYYNFSQQTISINHNGETKWIYWGEGDTMTKWQICVTYEHESVWEGFKQESNITQYEAVIEKLIAGEDVTIMFYGDSITCGANASWFLSQDPGQRTYAMLFTEALADLFGYTVNYIDVSYLQPGMIKPTPEPYVAGERGTITYINTAIGGWTSTNGLQNFDTHVKPFVEEYGCDLFVIAFGGNDAPMGIKTATIASNFKSIIKKVHDIDSDAHFMMVATMVTNTLATNGWYTPNILEHEKEFLKASRQLNSLEKINGAVTNMTSMSLSVLDHKEFVDYTGNNINHPNDFFERVYAQTLLQSFIGYENMN